MKRKFFHQIHLWLSIPTGIFITVICLSGAILVFEKDVLQWLNPQVEVASLRKNDPARRELTGMQFFQTTRALHRWFLDPPPKKGQMTAGKMAVGSLTLVMVAITISGVVLWWPRTRKALKNRLSINCTKGWRRFWYDSHVALGLYCTILFLIIAITGLNQSFRWMHNILYSIFDYMPQKEIKPFLYSLHVGTWGGVWTQILYFIVSLIGAILPLSGYYLWWKKK
ncbi:PepSY-associated TM helix domain-containing protein [uncultured Parabacteroides sp.]|uniref:PepSY-associated TM helix domain-containing protein n=1 Tax=uncultured Parabacteroides sp. TaxID=512312 RepID=UPI0026185AF5|nr:PepSY-associated TM helix domain-containing protein [uncultured Parabacteroides sp.]